MLRILVIVTLLASGSIARADPPVTVEAGVVFDSSRYAAHGRTSGLNTMAAFVDGVALRVAVGAKVQPWLGVFVRGSVTNERDVTYVLTDTLGIPYNSGTDFRIWNVGLGPEVSFVDDKAFVAPWIGAIRVDTAFPRTTDTTLGYGIDVGFDVLKFDMHRLAVMAGASHTSGLVTVTFGVAYRLR